MGDEKNYKSDLRTPNQRKKDAWAEKIAKKPRPKPTYINGNVIDLHPFIHDPWWLIHEEKPEDEDTSIPIEEKINKRIAKQKRSEGLAYLLGETIQKFVGQYPASGFGGAWLIAEGIEIDFC